MRVALVSTYPPTACGIANYTAALSQTIGERADAEVTILAERTSDDAPDAPGVMRCWHRRGNWVEDVLAAVDHARPDVVHVQHEETILGQDRRLPALFERLGERGIGSVVTLHSVYSGGLGWLPGRWAPVRFQRTLGRVSDRIIVHQHRGCEDFLLTQGVPRHKVEVIAHGTHAAALPERATARAALGYPDDALVVAFLGFIHPKKGLHCLVDAFSEVVAAEPRARLLIAGKPRRRPPFDPIYHRWLGAKMRPGTRAGWLDYRPGFHPHEQVANFLAASDVLALPYRQAYGSASGILHTALGAGKPLLCSSGLKFSEAIDEWAAELPDLFPAPGDTRAWAASLRRVLGDVALRQRLAELSAQLGEKTGWPVVAGRHLEAYRAAIDERRGAGHTA